LTADSVSREYQERIKAARNDALTAIARSICEGVVPNKDKIQAVLSSIRRQSGIREQDFETPATVIVALPPRRTMLVGREGIEPSTNGLRVR
jgi:hypothetical protein